MKDSVEQFVEVARQFQTWVTENSDEGPEAARRALLLVSRLYVSALALPPRKCEDYRITETTETPDWSIAYQTLSARLPFRRYSEASIPGALPSADADFGDLADDLADIFLDVDKGLQCYDAGYRADAIWVWRDRLILHWGDHATAAMRALHCWIAAKHPEMLVDGCE